MSSLHITYLRASIRQIALNVYNGEKSIFIYLRFIAYDTLSMANILLSIIFIELVVQTTRT